MSCAQAPDGPTKGRRTAAGDAESDGGSRRSEANDVRAAGASSNGAEDASPTTTHQPTARRPAPLQLQLSTAGAAGSERRGGAERWNGSTSSPAGAPSGWGLGSALLSVGSFVRSLRGIVALGAANRRWTHPGPWVNPAGGSVSAGAVGAGGVGAALAPDEVSPPPTERASSDSTTVRLEVSGNSDGAEGGTEVGEEGDAEEEEEWEARAEAEAVEAEAQAAAVAEAEGSAEEEAGAAGSVERWDAFLMRLRGGVSAASLVGLSATGVWTGSRTDTGLPAAAAAARAATASSADAKEVGPPAVAASSAEARAAAAVGASGSQQTQQRTASAPAVEAAASRSSAAAASGSGQSEHASSSREEETGGGGWATAGSVAPAELPTCDELHTNLRPVLPLLTLDASYRY